MKRANERNAFLLNKYKEDKALFIKNLGWLLSQTREDIVECEYIAKEWPNNLLVEFVDIKFGNGYHTIVNIHMDNYVEIIKDVIREIGSD